MKKFVSISTLGWVLAIIFAGTSARLFYSVVNQAERSDDMEQEQRLLNEQNSVVIALLNGSHLSLTKQKVRKICAEKKIETFDKGKDEVVAGQVVLRFKGERFIGAGESGKLVIRYWATYCSRAYGDLV